MSHIGSWAGDGGERNGLSEAENFHVMLTIDGSMEVMRHTVRNDRMDDGAWEWDGYLLQPQAESVFRACFCIYVGLA